MSTSPPPEQPPRSPARNSLWATACSVAASFFGVQTAKNRQRDFTQGKATHFIVIGLVMTILLVVGLVMIVRLVLRQAGA
jgi:cytochrome b subunit of formate dehydrogenase